MSDSTMEPKYPEWLTKKVNVDKLPKLNTSSIRSWTDYICDIKLEDLNDLEQAKFTDANGRIGIVKQVNGRVMTVFLRISPDTWCWTLQDIHGESTQLGPIVPDQFEWTDEMARFPSWINNYFNDKLKDLKCIKLDVKAIIGEESCQIMDEFTTINFVTFEHLGNHKAKRFVDSFGRPGLVKNNFNGTITTMYPEFVVTPSEWTSVTYKPSSQGRVEYIHIRDEDDFIPWIEPIGYELNRLQS